MFMAHPPLYLCVLRHDQLPVYRCCSQHLVTFDARGPSKVPRLVFFEEFDRPGAKSVVSTARRLPAVPKAPCAPVEGNPKKEDS
jgi:hypothetical protein